MFTGDRSSYHDTVMKWTTKEMQLNRLHEEIVTTRESLQNITNSYHRCQAKRGFDTMNNVVIHSHTDAMHRNRQLLQDINDCKISLNEDRKTPGNIRFLTLQSNYWAMVNGLFPLWERSCFGLSDENEKENENNDTAVGLGVTFASPVSSMKHASKTT